MLRRIAAFFFNRITLALVGLLLLSLVIWFVGPLVAIDRFRPLEGEGIRWLIIGLLWLLWLLKQLLQWWRSRNMNGRMMASLARFTASDPNAQTPGAGQLEVKELEGRFKEAVDTLSKARFAQAEGGLFGRFTRRYIYQLPWYLIIGSPGSGKTTALVNSGLNFPLADKFGKGSIRGVGGTRNCDWWFTDQAVLLDTAGRYTTQESDAQQDSAAWRGFLQLLRRFRARQPINGVLVTLSVQDLLSSTEAERSQLAQAIGQRLAELCEELALRFPVYVLVTKTDLLAGFSEFFGPMSREERAQVLGFTFPYEEGAVLADPLVRFGEEFDLVARQVDRLLPQRLAAEPDLARRGLLYALPQQFVGLREVVHDTLAQVFASTRFKEKPLLRGIYFTSGTQEGMPFDRVMSSLSRRFGVQSGLAQALKTQSGRSYFIETLFKDVIFNEAGLTGRNARKERQLRLLQAGGLAGLALALVGLGAAWFVSFGNNRDYLGEVASNVGVLRQAVDEAKLADADSMVALLPMLDHAETVARSGRYEGDSAPLSWRWGLLQVPKMEAAAESTYLRLLEDAWLPRLSRQLRRSLQEVATDNPEASYEALKTYLMLYTPEHFDAAVVRNWMATEWTRTLPPQAQERGIIDRLAHHLDALTRDRTVSAREPIDATLVAEVRQRLLQMSPAQRAYSRLKQLLLTDPDQPPDFTVVRAAGPEAPQVFTRHSGKPLTQGIPGLFTYDGYHGLFLRQLAKTTTLLSHEEGWVLGQVPGGRSSAGSAASEALTGQLANEVKRLYLMDYAKRWEDYLADVRPVPIGSLEQAGEQARLYAAPNSSIEQFVRAVARETTLSQKPDSGGSGSGSTSSWLGEKLNRIKEEQAQLSRLTGRQVNVAGLATSGTLEADIVDARFREYRRLAGVGATGPAPIVNSLAVINEAATVIASARQQVTAGGSVPPTLAGTLEKVRGESQRLPAPMSVMFNSLAAATSGLVGSDVRRTIGGNLNATIGDFCRKAISGRYPFTRGASKDVTADDFARLFAPGGLFDEFFRAQLQPMVDISREPWTFKQGIDGTPVGGSAALAAFQRAATIRDVYFRSGGRQPSLRVEIKPLDMDASLAQMVLDVDGEVLRYQHGPQIPKSMTWPGARGTNQVRLQLTTASGENLGLLTEGPWALHRLFDRAQLAPGSTPERFIASFAVEGRRLRVEVTASSVQNPFRLPAMEGFACPSQL